MRDERPANIAWCNGNLRVRLQVPNYGLYLSDGGYPMSTEDREHRMLESLIRTELASIPLDGWRQFAPCHIAVWRFIEQTQPGILGPLNVGSSGGDLQFSGEGASWFCEIVSENEEYLDAVERIMYPLVPRIPRRAFDRGFLYENEVPGLDEQAVRELATVVRRLCKDVCE